MTLGEIKAEVLRVIGANLSEDVSAENIDELLEDESYRSYLVNMTGPLNRCLMVFLRRGVLEKPVSVTRNSPHTLELSVLGVSDELALVLPLYVASELCVADDYDVSARMRSEFETALGEIMAHSGVRQERVSDVMGGLK